jgi:hypothetical protein
MEYLERWFPQILIAGVAVACAAGIAVIALS